MFLAFYCFTVNKEPIQHVLLASPHSTEAACHLLPVVSIRMLTCPFEFPTRHNIVFECARSCLERPSVVQCPHRAVLQLSLPPSVAA